MWWVELVNRPTPMRLNAPVRINKISKYNIPTHSSICCRFLDGEYSLTMFGAMGEAIVGQPSLA